MKKATKLVFIPAPGIGHIVSAVEIAKLLVARDDQLFITVLIMKLPLDSKPKGADDTYTGSQRIKFINLPDINIDTQGISPANFFKLFVESHNYLMLKMRSPSLASTSTSTSPSTSASTSACKQISSCKSLFC